MTRVRPRLLMRAGLSEARCRRRLAFLDFGPEDEANLAEIHQLAGACVDEIVDAFYAHLWEFEETRRILGDDRQVKRLKRLQREYFLQMTAGKFDADYFESRLRVGDAHQRVGLEPEWYLGAYNMFLRFLIERLRSRYPDDAPRLSALIGSLSKVIFFDMGLAVDAYIMSGYVHEAFVQEYRRVAEIAERSLRERVEVDRAKADLANLVVHDLKGPLGGILTVTQLALRKRKDIGETDARRFEQIQRSARDLLRMIENLLEIDQMEGERLELRVEPVDVGGLIEECAAEFRAAAELAEQSIDVEIAGDVPVVATDRWLLRRVLNNLVVNAIRHSGAQGKISLTAEHRDGRVYLRVRDQGRGLASEDRESLFSKFRVRGEHREDTGLGLVFCKMAVEAMGGEIGVDSAPGEGCTFTVNIPTSGES